MKHHLPIHDSKGKANGVACRVPVEDHDLFTINCSCNGEKYTYEFWNDQRNEHLDDMFHKEMEELNKQSKDFCKCGHGLLCHDDHSELCLFKECTCDGFWRKE